MDLIKNRHSFQEGSSSEPTEPPSLPYRPECLLYYNSVANFVMMFKQEYNVQYIEHKN